MLFSPDYVGASDELADQLYAHAGFQRADEVAFALPFTFGEADYRQIVTDLRPDQITEHRRGASVDIAGATSMSTGVPPCPNGDNRCARLAS